MIGGSPACADRASFAAHAPYILLAALLAGDILFMTLHWLHLHSTVLRSELWSIERDGSFGEMYQYLKYLGVGLALAHLYRSTRLPVLLGWIGVFAFLLLDDSMRIHERFGLGMVAWIHLPDFGGLRGRDLGELIFAGLVVAILAPVLALGYVRGSPASRALTADLSVLLAALAACAVGGDTIHRLLSGTALNTLAGMIEDGGEMIALSLTSFYIAQWVPYRASTPEAVRFRPGSRLLTLAFARPLSE
ncbi:MAG TPA: hypothetical protein VGD45_28510 [Steroidobacter sp.]|uniref:hypothetical protein n=1 Tax=Steroidobacter sp. TaxID=1978227 RepID=UPI002ED8E1ED